MKGDFTRWTFDPKKHYHGVLSQQGRVDLDADRNEQNAIAAYRTETEATDVIGASGAPMDNAGFLISVVSNKLTISKGRAYVDGILCVNEQAIAIDAQPDLPGFQVPTAAGSYLAYLTVWLRHLTPLDDAAMLEVALGGADTCTRAKTVCQVNLVPVAAAQGATVNCATPVAVLVPVIPATLMARAEPDPSADDPCSIPAKAGFRSLENQLYRVEIHDGGDAASGKATCKWSRDNGSIVTSWDPKSVNGNQFSVASTGRDSVLGFAAGQWIEFIDDSLELNFKPGIMVQLTNVQGSTLTIDPATAIPAGAINFSKFTLNPKVRRWDSVGVLTVKPGQWLDLENGVQVNFGVGLCQTGDYWSIPARTLTADIDWPIDGSNNPVAVPPLGIRRHLCRLAVVNLTGTTWSLVASCLPLFPPLTAITQRKGIHVTDVKVTSGTSIVELLNDSNQPIPNVEAPWQIQVLFDAPIDPVSAQPTTCFLTLELPYPLDVYYLLPNGVPETGKVELFGYQPLIVPAQVLALSEGTFNAIVLRFDGVAFAVVYNLLNAGFVNRMVARLTLKGNFIWGRGDPTTYLDGAAYGIARQDADGAHIGVNLPKSGNGVPGSDFNMWFWFFRPVKIASLLITPNPVTVGQNASGYVYLDGFAPPGAVVTLTADSNAGTLSPTSVPIAAGGTGGNFTVTNTSVPAGAVSTVLNVTATYAGSTKQVGLTINQVLRLTGFSFNTNTVTNGGSVIGTVTLNLPAPVGGIPITLTTDKPANLPLPPTALVVPATQSKANFTMTGAGVATNSSVVATVTVSYGGVTLQASVTVSGPRLN